MRWFLICLAILAPWVAGNAEAAQPRTISYQGSLLNEEGGLVPDGNYVLIFRLWNAASGGSEMWQETDIVPVAGSLFNVLLGKNTPLTLDFNAPYWLGISVGANPELAPRVELAASPYAIRAAVADSLSGGLPGELTCSATRSTMPIPHIVETPISLTAESWDDGPFHDNAVNPTRYTAPVAGKFLVTGFITWDANGSGFRSTMIKKNGTTYECLTTVTNTPFAAQSVTAIVRLAAGDYVELVVAQGSGASQPVSFARLQIILLDK